VANLPSVLLPGRRDAAPYNQILRIRRTWPLAFGVAAKRGGRPKKDPLNF